MANLRANRSMSADRSPLIAAAKQKRLLKKARETGATRSGTKRDLVEFPAALPDACCAKAECASHEAEGGGLAPLSCVCLGSSRGRVGDACVVVIQKKK